MSESSSPSPVSKAGGSVQPDGAGCLWSLIVVELLNLLVGGLLEWFGRLDTETWVLWSNAALMLLLVVVWLTANVSKGKPSPVAKQGEGDGTTSGSGAS